MNDLNEAKRLNGEIERIEKEYSLVTGNYWDFGRELIRLRTEGQNPFTLGFDRTRVTRAIAIAETFERREDCEKLPLKKAYDQRTRVRNTTLRTGAQEEDANPIYPNEEANVGPQLVVDQEEGDDAELEEGDDAEPDEIDNAVADLEYDLLSLARLRDWTFVRMSVAAILAENAPEE